MPYLLRQRNICIFAFMKSLWISLLLSFMVPLFLQAQTTELPLLSPDQAKKDVSYFENLFFSSHIDLPLVTDTTILRTRIDTLRNGITDSMSATEFYKRIIPIFSSIRDIHCSLSLPAESNDYYQAGNLYLPLNVFVIGESIYVRNDLFDSLTVGARIIRINKAEASDIWPVLMVNSSSEGDNIHTREKVAEYYFTSVYPLYFAVDTLNSILLEVGDDSVEYFLPGVDRQNSLYSTFFETPFEEDKFPFQFGYTDDKTIAYMRIATFMGGNPGEYRSFLNNTFRYLNDHSPRALILDLRRNGGGFADYGKSLTRFLMPERYTYINNIVSKSSRLVQQEIIRQSSFQPEIIRLLQYTFGNKAMRTLWEKTEGIVDTTFEKTVKPVRPGKRYTGFLVVMFDGMSASTTGLVCNTLRKRPNTLFTGLPAGCCISGTFGQPTAFELPNSGITGQISVLRFNQDTVPCVLTPIMPDLELPEPADSLDLDKDSQLQQIIAFIRNKIKEQ